MRLRHFEKLARSPLGGVGNIYWRLPQIAADEGLFRNFIVVIALKKGAPFGVGCERTSIGAFRTLLGEKLERGAGAWQYGYEVFKRSFLPVTEVTLRV